MNSVTWSQWFCHQQRSHHSNAYACVMLHSASLTWRTWQLRGCQAQPRGELRLWARYQVGWGRRVESREDWDRILTSWGFKIYCKGGRERKKEVEENWDWKRGPHNGGNKNLRSCPKAGCLCPFWFFHSGVSESWMILVRKEQKPRAKQPLDQLRPLEQPENSKCGEDGGEGGRGWRGVKSHRLTFSRLSDDSLFSPFFIKAPTALQNTGRPNLFFQRCGKPVAT